jgi:hypothetical protein
MTKVLAGITTSVDGYVAGPDDGPGRGLGEGGEQLHYWVFDGPWTYESPPTGEPTGDDAAWLEELIGRIGGRPRRREAPVRGLLEAAHAGAPRRAAVAVRDLRRLSGAAPVMPVRRICFNSYRMRNISCPSGGFGRTDK